MSREKEKQKRAENAETICEGIDFTWEGGLMVLTSDFLKKRGYCCRNRCRNCPYLPKWEGPVQK